MTQTDKALKNLESISIWVDSAPDFTAFLDNNEFMVFSDEMMNRCLYMLKVGTALAPTEDVSRKGWTKHRAIIVGHMVRIVKLYEGILIHISNRQLELALIFQRPIFETVIRLKYMLQSNSKPQSIRSFILASYRPEKEMLQHLASLAVKRPLIPIEQRIKTNINASLKKDGISHKELLSNRRWNIDGKDFRSILNDLNYSIAYSYGFGNSSHYVHGDWHDIRHHHIDHIGGKGRYYTIRFDFSEPDPRIACPITILCLDALHQFLEWGKLDPDEFLLPLVDKMSDLSRELDIAHEQTLRS